jgi:hypothetical protein
MKSLFARSAIVAALAAATLGLAARRSPDLVVHEWGTFTTVAAQDGRVVEWLPLGGPADLPCFVNVLPNAGLLKAPVVIATGAAAAGQVPAAPLNYDQARASLKGTVRMETPVIYFYTPHQEAVNVRVDFPQGLITEWYPPAAVAQPLATANSLRGAIQSSISWNGLFIRPGANPPLPVGREGPSHYYAAREVDAAPVSAGGMDEKFLFYRGVGSFPVPLSTTLAADGGVIVKNTSPYPIPALVLFENRAGKVGFTISSHLVAGKPDTMQRATLTGSVAALGAELEKMLVATGLFEREAKAMVKTWEDSWFEDGLRVFYVLPKQLVDDILPLSVWPEPKQIARGFVGRMEVIDEVTMSTVSRAISMEDDATLQAYGRFLGPITERMFEAGMASSRDAVTKAVEASYQAYVSRLSLRCP